MIDVSYSRQMKILRDWGPGGYDRIVTDRWLYGVGSRETGRVKVGMVLDENGLSRRLSQIRSKRRDRSLEMIAKSVVVNVNHEETEHIEATVRLWLTRSKGFSFIGFVDWLQTPDGYDFAQMQSDLDEAVRAATSFGI